MQLYQILFVIVYLIVMVSYFFTETGEDFSKRVINKVILATMFLVYGYVEFFRFYDGKSPYFYIMIAALLLSWLGDVFLLYKFVQGGIFFACGNIAFFIFECFLLYHLGFEYKFLIIFAVIFALFWGSFFILSKRKWINFAGHDRTLLMYLATVTMQGGFGLALAINYHTTPVILFGCGLALFMISDYFLMIHKYKFKTNAMLRCNSGTYFTGMMLVALSFSYFFK